MSQRVAHAEDLQLLQVRRAGCHGQASIRAASRLSWQQACELPSTTCRREGPDADASLWAE